MQDQAAQQEQETKSLVIKFFAFIVRKNALQGLPRGYSEGQLVMLTGEQIKTHIEWIKTHFIPAPWLNGQIEITDPVEKMRLA